MKDVIHEDQISNVASGVAQAVVGSAITKSFGNLNVLNDLSIAISKGSTYCLLGPNGSGKTTLIRIMVGLVRPDRGKMYVLGRPVARVQEIYPQIGYMTQHKALYPDLTLQENLEFFAGLYGIRGRERSDRISELLEMVALAEYRHKLTGVLSGGMYQRLSLACTLIHQPKLLLLDEPTVGIDPSLRQVFWKYFDHLASLGSTILITTHLMDEAEKCQMVGYMQGGKMQAQGSPEEILRIAGLKPLLKLWADNPAYATSSLIKRGFDAKQMGDEVHIRLESHLQLAEVLDLARPLDLRLVEPNLEEAFLKLGEKGGA